MIKINSKGNFDKTKEYMTKSVKITKMINAEDIASDCVKKLKRVTPKDTGLTSESWSYKIKKDRYKTVITISNENIQNGLNIVLLLEYGHGAANGSWVSGAHFVQPSVQKEYNKVLKEIEEELKKL